MDHCYILTLDELVVVQGLGGESDFEVARVRGSRKGLVVCETLAGLTLHVSPDCILDCGEEEGEGEEEDGEMEGTEEEMEGPVEMDDGEHDEFVVLMQQQHLEGMSIKAADNSSSSSQLVAEYAASGDDTSRQLDDSSLPTNPRDCISHLLRGIAACKPSSPDYVLSLSRLVEYLCRQNPSLAGRLGAGLERERERCISGMKGP